MDGFGFCLTGGGATHLVAMAVPARTALLKELFFDKDGNGIGVQFFESHIGALGPQRKGLFLR